MAKRDAVESGSLVEVDPAEIRQPDLPRWPRDEPPPASEELEKIFTHLVEDTNVSQKVIAGLRWAAAGYNWREVADILGSPDTRSSHIRQMADRYGILKILTGTDRIMNLQREIAFEASRATLERIREDPDDVSLKDMAIVAGIATDKVAMREGWKSGGAAGGESSFVAELRKIAEEGHEVKFSLEIDAGAQVHDAKPPAEIDITPRGDE
jgi:hypothetical protein